MRHPPFKFRAQAAQVDFQSSQGIVARLRRALAQVRGEDLNLNHVASSDDRVFLQSPTGSTQVEMVEGRLTLQTLLFADFIKPEEGSLRAAYMKSKLSHILPILEKEGAKFLYLGVSSEARLSWSDVGDRATLHRAAISAANLRPELTEGQPCFDFTLRVSRALNDEVFSNMTLQWYQERSLTMQMIGSIQGMVGRSPAAGPQLTDEGVQFQYDRNNKAGLLAGRQTWPSAEFVAMASEAIEAAPAALAPVTELISTALTR